MRKHIQPCRMLDDSVLNRPSLIRRVIVWITLVAYVGQPLAVTAQVAADQAAAANNRPVVDSTANGLPLVQITTPSAAGVSHNQYTQFNIDPAGLILNNSASIVQTRQAGYVIANPNLVNGAARVILNEVTSTHTSQLNGYAEVAGQLAEVVIANPNGITCNGCGFINTSRGILTTGSPVMGASGSLDAFRVTGGLIQIGSAGMNGSNLSQSDLIARSVKVNGELWAADLNVITGTNLVDYSTLGVQLIQGDASKPAVGIDVALLGGMYANKIRLLGTEAGVGVNSLGSLSAQAGDFNLDNQGQITLSGSTTASGNLTLNSATGINNTGTLYSQQFATLTSTGGPIDNSGKLLAQGNLNLHAASVNSTGALGAGIDVNGNASKNGNLTITTSNRTATTGTNIAGGNMSVIANSINLATSQTSAWSGIDLNATAGNIDNSNGILITMLGLAKLNASGSLINGGGQIGSGQDLNITAATINGNGRIVAGQDATIALQGNYNNAATSVIKANRNLTFGTTGTFTNQTVLEAVGNLTVNAAGLDNQAGAQINSAHTTLNTGAGDISNAGRIEGNIVDTSSNNISNTATVIGDAVSIQANNVNNLNAAAMIAATQSINLIVVNALVNQDGANILSLGDINIGSNNVIDPMTDYLTGNAVSVTNRAATIEAVNNLRISAATITNERTVVGLEWGPSWTGTSVVGTPVPGGPNVNSYTTTYANQRFTATTTPAAKLLSGANMRFGGSILNNKYSTIIAGGTLTAQMVVDNYGPELLQSKTLSGTSSVYSGVFVPQSGSCGWISINCTPAHIAWNLVTTAYNPLPTYTPISGLNYTKQGLSPAAYFAAKGNKTVATNAAGTTSLNLSASTITVPTSGLYTIHSQPGQHYLIVTDPRFASYQNFISSDYMLNRLVLDPQQIQKRLGDGFYEQKLVTDQITAQTGHRYLVGYTDSQSQFMALLDSGVKAATDLQLVPGIALTAKQIDVLSQDIVWMVEREVILPDGSTERVLAPQAYLTRLHEGDLKLDGALIAANDISITASGGIANSGSIQGRNSNILQAKDITNNGGIIGSRGFTLLNADYDILNLSGQINGNTVGLAAGRDIRVERTSRDFTRTINLGESTDAGAGLALFRRASAPLIGVVSSTDLGLESGISATNNLSLNAGRDISIVAASLASGGDTTINVGRDLNAGVLTITETSTTSRYNASRSTVTQLGSNVQSGGNLDISAGSDMQLTSATLNVSKNASLIAGGNLALDAVKNSLAFSFDTGVMQQRSYDETVLGTKLNAGGNITLAAVGAQAPRIAATLGSEQASKGNITLESASVGSANGNLALIADADVNINNIDEKHQSFRQTRVESSGFLSSTTTTTRDESSRTDAIGSSLDGNNTIIQSGRDINVTGSGMVATYDIALGAGNNITLAAAQSTAQSSSFRDEQTSGLFSNGGLSVTLGSKQQTDTQAGLTTTHAASTVGSIMGNVSMHAGKRYTQTGSDVLTPQGNIDIAAQNALIDEAQNTGSNIMESKSKQSGLTVAVSNPVLNAAQTARRMDKAASQTSSGRMKTLAAANAALAVNNAWDAVNKGMDKADGNLADNMGGIDVSVSIGNSSSQSSTAQTWSHALGSNLSSEGNINIQAIGAGKDSDLTLQGSTVKAGNTATLTADHAISLLAAHNTAAQTSSNRNSSNSIGVGVSTNNGWTVNLAASRGRGNADGDDVTWSNTHVDAGNTLILKSGSDTTLKGASASGNQVIADIGGNLTIESLQDTSRYQSEQKNAGFSIAIPIAGTGSASVNYNKSNANSNYASVIEQSGIKAGSGGFQVKAQGNTDLKGGVIASSDAAIADHINTLTTASLTTIDIENKAEARAESRGINLSNDMMSQGKYGVTKGVIGNALSNASESGSSSGQTRSAVSEGTVNITDEVKQFELNGKDVQDTVASLNRNTSNAQVAAQRLDVLAMERTAQAEQAIKQETIKQAVKFTDESYRKIFLVKHPMYEHVRGADGKLVFDENGKPVTRELTDDEKRNLKSGPDGKISIANNGIFNDADAAAKYANQHSTTDGPQYLIYFPEADNVVSELLIAGYQKFLENDFWGLSNSTQETKDMMNQYGQGNLRLDGHSRGAMTIGNALESVQNQPNAQGTLSGTTIDFYGAAYNAEKADGILGDLQNRDAVTDISKLNGMVIQTQTHKADPVGRIIGGNPATGGTIPEGSSTAKEAINVLGGENTVHNCYGAGDQKCKDFWRDTPNNQPVLQPVKIYPANQPKE